MDAPAQAVAPPQLLRAEDIAEILGISRSKAYAMMRTRELPVLKIGTRIRVPATAFNAWIAANTEGGA